jgi:Uma2 family endonuclease
MTAEAVDTVALPDRQVWTLDDLLALPDDGHRYEIIDGSLLMSAAATPGHQVAAYRLANALRAAAPGDVEVAEAVAVDLGLVGLGIQVPVPDIVVGSGAAFWGGGKGLTPADVLLAVEIVSPGSTGRDRIFKPGLFGRAGIPAFWRVELDGPGTPLVVVYALDGDVYREVRTVRSGEVVSVDVPFRVQLRPADLVGPRRKG